MSEGNPVPFWVTVMLLVTVGASVALNVAQAYHRHLFENQWQECSSRIVYEGICVPEAPTGGNA